MHNEEILINLEASGRHVHLCRADVETLFGKDHQLTPIKELSQPGQFACEERVTLTGPKGSLHRVIVLGPERPESQAEVSMTDATALGVKAPVRMSGDLQGSPGCTISTERGSVTIDEGLIVAKSHIHMTPEDAEKYGLTDGQVVNIAVASGRPLTFNGVAVRVSPKFATYMHIDYDEANACGFVTGMKGCLEK